MRIHLSFVILILILILPTAVIGQNVLNDGFEQGRKAWEPAGTGTIDRDKRHTGKASLKLVDTDETKYFAVNRRIDVKPDSLYEIRFWCFTNDARYATLYVSQQDAEGKRAVFNGKPLVHWHFPFRDRAERGQWKETKARFVTGPTTVRCTIGLNPANASRTHTGTAWFDDVSLRYIEPEKMTADNMGILPPTDRAEKSLPLNPLPPLELNLASPGCVILCPEIDILRPAAKELAAAIAQVTKNAPKIVSDTADPASLGRGPLLVMGNLMISAAGRKLYLTGYDFTDYAWPGKGGRVVRTIRDPFGTGAHVLLIGGSYPEDVAAAARRAADIIKDRGPKLRYINDVKLGENADLIKGWTSDYCREDADWRRVGELGSWEYLWRIGKAGMGYLRTGDEAYLPHFKRELLYFFEHDVFNRKQETHPQIHSLIDAVFVPWNLFADHPFFTPEERRSIDEKFLLLACSQEGPRPLQNQGWRLRGNHGLGKALDGFWLGRYFWRRYRIPEAREWMDIVDEYFAPQLASNKPREDGGYHQFRASLLCTLMYALAAGKEDYLKSQVLKEAADRAVLEYPVSGGPMTYLGAYAVAVDDPGYLCQMACAGREGYIKYCASMKGGSLLGENLRSFCGFDTPQEKKDLLGANVAPLSPMWHKEMKGLSSRTEFAVTTSPEESYDKLIIRDGYGAGDFHLVVDGLGGGGHSFQDANCITQYRDKGFLWLRQEYGYKGPTCSTLRQQNGVFLALNGQGPPGVHACAKLLYVDQLSENLCIFGGALDGLGDVAWQRHIMRKNGAWTLVVDRVIARKAGELFAERHWHIRGNATASTMGVISRQGTVAFHLQSAGLAASGMSGTSNRTEIIRAALPADGHIDIASLIWVDDKPEENRYQLAQTSKGWRVSDAKAGNALDAAMKDGRLVLSPEAADAEVIPPSQTLPVKLKTPLASLPCRRVELGDEVTAVATGADAVAAGTRNGSVVVLGLDGTKRWQTKVGSWVLSLHFMEKDLLVGEDDGTLSRFDATGRKLWSRTLPYIRIGWSHWSDQRSRICEITSADMDGDGKQEILLSNGDRRVYALTGDGKELWKKAGGWGVSIALTPTTYEGKFALFAGIRGPTLAGRVAIFDATGRTLERLHISRMGAQQIRDVRLFDVTGNGKQEIIVARDTPSNQVAVCNAKRDRIWKADVGGSPDGLALRKREGKTQVLCASRCGYLHALDGATGRQLWFCYLGDNARMLWPRADGTILALCPSGNIFVISASGKIVGCENLGTPITALLRPGEDRVAPSCIPVGTKNGVLRILTPRR
ncbi:MAG: PQQ-binding-like beta-propeller repeat protein [Planctomycetes bacterium]|nr:PQQ-binding-like beta-propeller repeat protein [Planctomycetota bacterium]